MSIKISPALILAAMLATNLAGCASGSDGASNARSRCSEVRDRVADIRVARIGSADSTSPVAGEIDKHRRAMVASLGDSFLDQCVSRGPAFSDCVLDADDADMLARCNKDLAR